MITNLFSDNKTLNVLSALVLITLALFLGFKTWFTWRESVQVGKPTPYEFTINVDGVGRAEIRPDIARVSFAVESRAETLSSAQNDNSERMNSLIEKIKTLGMDAKDIQTSTYNAYEEKKYDPQTGTYDKVIGWVVSQTVELTIRDLEKVSSILETVGQNNATNISGPNFAVENDLKAVDEARLEAIADAQSRAQAIADQLGVKLNTPTSYNEWKDGGPIIYGYAKVEAVADDVSVAPTIEEGQEEVTLHVSVTYSIKQ
ncbi:SIMPL domain-containing protein [Candidatus Uhrbacteria bacterium]|nr:SIMPL domain-containing protein [Candidatus Uhrbacteria bacterium]